MLVIPDMYASQLGNVHVSASCVKNLMAGCFGGAGFLLLQLSGTGTVFITGGGSIIEKYLMPGEELLVDTDSLVAFSHRRYQVWSVEGLMTCCCGKVGVFIIVTTMWTPFLQREKLREKS
jgi:uncharacterized protein (AIM24 family)